MSNIFYVSKIYKTIKMRQFLFEELVKRDFKQKYKRTILGVGWSVLSPLMTMVVLYFIFGYFFGRNIPHYAIYLLCGNLIFSYFREATTGGMNSLVGNAGVITKINVPKYIFLLSKNVSSLINFGVTLFILFAFIIGDNVDISWCLMALVFPIICLLFFNIGVGMILSAYYVFYRDISYLYDLLLMLIMYASAIFYRIDIINPAYRFMFYCNPVWVYINYFREIILYGNIPSLGYHALCIFYAFLSLGIGAYIYRIYNHKFLYYF